jgi:hypothetical protein
LLVAYDPGMPLQLAFPDRLHAFGAAPGGRFQRRVTVRLRITPVHDDGAG